MSEQPVEEPLDLQRAQFDAPPPALACHRCNQPLATRYFSVNGQGVCAACLERAERGQQSSLPKALLLGSAAGAVGALVYYAIRTLSGYDLALITIVIGIGVGLGVRMGAGDSRNIGYRLLAVALTWIAMCSTYVPAILAQGGAEGTPLALPVAIVFSLIMPLLFVINAEILGTLIFAFGLWEAYRLSAPRPFVVEGPFEPSTAKS